MRFPVALRRWVTKNLTIVHDGFTPRDVVHWSDAYRTRQSGLDSNVIMAPVQWVMRTFTEAVARVQRRDGKIWDFVDGHRVEALIDQPNPWYDGDTLWKGTSLSYTLSGNAYWQKIRNAFGDVIELWYRPHTLMKPHSPDDGSVLIDYWEYHHGRAGSPERIPVRDVVHLRFGIDPRDERLGLSPLGALMREISTDDEAARFSHTILKNLGVPGFTIAPANGDYIPNDAEVEKLKDYLNTQFRGEGRGDAMVFKFPTSIIPMGVDPSKMAVTELRNIAEERVCAMVGVQPAVVGFGAGLEQATVGAQMRELRELSWVSCIHPMQNSMGRQLTRQLLGEFTGQPARFRVRFDRSDAAEFAEDKKARADTAIALVGGGLLRVDQGQALAGVEVDDTQKVYLRPFSVVEVGPDAREDQSRPGQVQPDPNAAPPGTDGGNSGDGTDGMATDPAAKMMRDLEEIARRRGYASNGHHLNGDTR